MLIYFGVLGDVCDAMQSIGVGGSGRDEQRTRLLHDAPGFAVLVIFMLIDSFVGFTRLHRNVEGDRPAKAHGGYDGMVCCAILVRHNALSGLIFVDQTVVNAMRRICKDTQVLKAVNDRVYQPVRKRRSE